MLKEVWHHKFARTLVKKRRSKDSPSHQSIDNVSGKSGNDMRGDGMGVVDL